MPIQTQEARIILAIEAIRTTKRLNSTTATKLYNMLRSTLRDRMNGRTTLSERRPPAQKLTELEESVLLQYIFDLDSKGPYTKIPELISAWFRLVENIRVKYSVLDCNFYNFDETGFMIGVICSVIVVIRADRRSRSKAVQPGN
jgi:hypothetical protein